MVWPEPRNVTATANGVRETQYTFPISLIDFNLPPGKAQNCQQPDVAAMVLGVLGDHVGGSGSTSLPSATRHSLLSPLSITPDQSYELGTPQ